LPGGRDQDERAPIGSCRQLRQLEAPVGSCSHGRRKVPCLDLAMGGREGAVRVTVCVDNTKLVYPAIDPTRVIFSVLQIMNPSV
jgi:hypothetical protein